MLQLKPHPENVPAPNHRETPRNVSHIPFLQKVCGKPLVCAKGSQFFLILFRYRHMRPLCAWMLPRHMELGVRKMDRRAQKFSPKCTKNLRPTRALEKAPSLLFLCKSPQPILILIKLINRCAADKDSYSLTYATAFIEAVSLNELLQGSLNFDLNWT